MAITTSTPLLLYDIEEIDIFLYVDNKLVIALTRQVLGVIEF